MFLRTPWNYDRNEASVESGLACLDPSKAQQNQKEEADINTIVRRFGVTGVLPQGARPVFFGEFEGIFDYRTAMDSVIRAQKAFGSLPAEVRKRFGNDPQEFVAFCSDEKNVEELRRMGLAKPKVESPPSVDTPPSA